MEDTYFQSDCLAFTLFHGQNRVMSEYGVNHWIPFKEQEVDAPDNFKSHFMSDFIEGKSQFKKEDELFGEAACGPVVFSPAAQEVMEAGRQIWYYYLHHKDNSNELYGSEVINVNATFYDIRIFFQGKDDNNGKMKNKSSDEQYMALLKALRQKQRVLAKQIEQKAYLYGFLK